MLLVKITRRRLLAFGLFVLASGVFGQESPSKRAVEIERDLLKEADAASRAGRREEAISRYQAIIDHAVGEDVDIRAAAVRGLLAARYGPTSSFISTADRVAAESPFGHGWWLSPSLSSRCGSLGAPHP